MIEIEVEGGSMNKGPAKTHEWKSGSLFWGSFSHEKHIHYVGPKYVAVVISNLNFHYEGQVARDCKF